MSGLRSECGFELVRATEGSQKKWSATPRVRVRVKVRVRVFRTNDVVGARRCGDRVPKLALGSR